ncbi:hypothetical protein CBL_07829 [Carabus blaptoides fortunei]
MWADLDLSEYAWYAIFLVLLVLYLRTNDLIEKKLIEQQEKLKKMKPNADTTTLNENTD